jgi:hypothetical protein
MRRFLAEVGIFASHITWRFRHRRLLKSAKESGKPVDKLLEQEENRGNISNDEKQSPLSVAIAPGDQAVQVGGDEGSPKKDNPDLERGLD